MMAMRTLDANSYQKTEEVFYKKICTQKPICSRTPISGHKMGNEVRDLKKKMILDIVFAAGGMLNQFAKSLSTIRKEIEVLT